MPSESFRWDRRIDNAQQRFEILSGFSNEAVLDRETGLVWERRPSKNLLPWDTARLFCAQKAVGGRGGWRLPSFVELASLIDPSVANPSLPRLPQGHPFLDVQPGTYWSATAFADQPGFALAVFFFFNAGTDAPVGVTDANTRGTAHLAWAVRGRSHGPDVY